jgi:hypothetical protein
MPRRATLLAAAGVILAGVTGALLFRHPPVPAPAPETSTDEVLVRRRPTTAKSALPPSHHFTGQIETAAVNSPPVDPPTRPANSVAHEGVVNPFSVAARHTPFVSPPPQQQQSPFSQGGFSAPPPATPASQAPPAYVPPAYVPPAYNPPPAVLERTHIVVDGDTLTDIAEHYLGSGKRYNEIFAANRDLLQHPDLLPIGARLRIPAGNVAAASPMTESSTEPAGSMTPIPGNSWRRGRSKP